MRRLVRRMEKVVARWLKSSMAQSEREDADLQVRATVEGLLADIKARGDAAVREMSVKFDRWDRTDYRLTDREIRDCLSELSARDIEDIKFAQAQVRNFAEHQKAALKDIEVETLPGVILGHKNVPVASVGCTCRAANIRCSRQRTCRSSPPRWPACPSSRPARRRSRDVPRRRSSPRSIWQERMSSMRSAACRRSAPWVLAPSRSVRSTCWSARQCLCRGGEAPALRPRRHRPVRWSDRDAGHRRRHRRRRALRHGPARPSRARPHSPAILLTNSEKLARDTMAEVERLLTILPTAKIAAQAWRDYGEVILCDSEEEMVKVADEIASEHCAGDDARSGLFPREHAQLRRAVPGAAHQRLLGDKVIGTNHTLPTKKAARYTGGSGSASS